ncbi:hypothetical protein PSM36_2962 [Proteiniphilum saccharofermentans]|uniref:DUF5053 domain-containing protein n=1 Tax=Proteiniphilum saccharofermentans TaxID=1642647 RepID=A0A1R3T202_9BACT|nr:DUF5053 domain-containing protein [Proteiniphilum saccharofermentans]SCD21751.1 hypothetical protein PSM36_2962 [Proteiniphilum saccharofermentans]
MTTGEKFEELKKKDIAAKSDRERITIDKELEQLANNDPEGFEAAFIASAKQTLEDAKRLRIKEQMREITQFVSMSYIAKNYFNKTKSWLSQRINGNDVNGRPARFTPEEIDTLNKAFSDLSQKLGAFRVSL